MVENLPAQLLLPLGVSKPKCPVPDVFAKRSVNKSKRDKWKLLYEIVQGEHWVQVLREKFAVKCSVSKIGD